MMKRIFAISLIFVCTSLAWFILGNVTRQRTENKDIKLKYSVKQLWGSIHKQQAPQVYYRAGNPNNHKDRRLTLERSDITVVLELDHRKKGLLWYSTYQVDFSGKFLVRNNFDQSREMVFDYAFPANEGIYEDFIFSIDGEELEDLTPVSGRIVKMLNVAPNESKSVEVSYKSQGMDEWWYLFGQDVAQIKNFKLTILTDFPDIDFPEETISPSKKEKVGKGWKLTWEYSNLISGIQIGMDMPQKLNPGPFAARVSFFAPVSLFLFFFLMFIIQAVKRIELHPMNYFFLAAAFFSFHLLMTYLVDHVNIYLTFAICSAVSIFLVVSYMRLVVGTKFALFETGFSQLVYLVLFSYAFFLEGYTGLSITICCIVTLFLVMQFTGGINWETHEGNKRQQKQTDEIVVES